MIRGAVFLFLLALPGLAAAQEFGGRLKLGAIGYDAGSETLESQLGYARTAEATGQLRLEVSEWAASWRLETAAELDSRHGNAVARDLELGGGLAPFAFRADDAYWDLNHDFVEGGSTQTTGRIDRLSIGYARESLVVRLGRQALTWGGGRVFHPMDLVNPFQPLATDTTYKRGTDMGYAQWLFENGSDLQIACVPRRERDDPFPGAGRTTCAALANLVGETLQWTVLAGRDRSDDILGLGLSGPLGGAAWTLEAVPTRAQDGSVRTSALANVTYATGLAGRNLAMLAEAYHNGFGQSGSDYSAFGLDPVLVTRLRRGQTFVTGRDYLSLGADWEVTPLLRLLPTVVVNVHDRSALFDLQLDWSLGTATAVKTGVRTGAGPRGSEFRGLPASDGLYLAQPDQAFLRFERYF